METEQTGHRGFVLEGARGDYSGNMSVLICRDMFCRLASVGLPANLRPSGVVLDLPPEQKKQKKHADCG